MESELYIQRDLSNRFPGVNEGTTAHALTDSLLRSTIYQFGSQNESMIGLPILPSVQVDLMKNLHDSKSVRYEGDLNRSNFSSHEHSLGKTSLSGSLSTILGSRNCMNNDMRNSVVSLHQEVPSEPSREMFSGGCSYGSSSSFPTALNYGYDVLLGDVNRKWDQDRFAIQPELNNWRTSTSVLETVRFSDNQDVNEWVLPNSGNVCSSHPCESALPHNELSLSLATCGSAVPFPASIHQSQSQTRLGLRQTSAGKKELSLGCASNSRSPQFSQIISGSRYVSVLQQILSDIASYSIEGVDQSSYSNGVTSSSSNFPYPSNLLVDRGMSFDDNDQFCEDDGSFAARAESSYRRRELRSKKSQLLALLQAVDDRYNRCLDEVHTVISAFHAATEMDPQIHSSSVLRTISFFYKNLRERISNEILAMGSVGDNQKTLEKTFIQKQWALQQMKKKDQQLWRPQRGLPERSVSILRQWMFDNFLHPYPKDAEKHLLALKSGLTRSQVSNWFINARVRLWRPLVEEMCSELNRRKGSSENEEGTTRRTNHQSQLRIYDYSQQFDT